MRIKPKLEANWCRKGAIQIDCLGDIRYNIFKSGTNGAVTPPPPNRDGGVGSIITFTNYTTTAELPQTRKTYPQDWPAYNAARPITLNYHPGYVGDLETQGPYSSGSSPLMLRTVAIKLPPWG